MHVKGSGQLDESGFELVGAQHYLGILQRIRGCVYDFYLARYFCSFPWLGMRYNLLEESFLVIPNCGLL